MSIFIGVKESSPLFSLRAFYLIILREYLSQKCTRSSRRMIHHIHHVLQGLKGNSAGWTAFSHPSSGLTVLFSHETVQFCEAFLKEVLRHPLCHILD